MRSRDHKPPYGKMLVLRKLDGTLLMVQSSAGAIAANSLHIGLSYTELSDERSSLPTPGALPDLRCQFAQLRQPTELPVEQSSVQRDKDSRQPNQSGESGSPPSLLHPAVRPDALKCRHESGDAVS